MPTLVVRDEGQPSSVSFDDLLKYHGRSSIAGLAHAFKAMERGFPLLSPGLPPERYDVTVESGFPGGGARDAFEIVTPAAAGDRYLLTVDQGRRARGSGRSLLLPPALQGARGRVDLARWSRPGGVLRRRMKEGPTPAEADGAQQLKEEMADRLLGMPAEEVYDAATVG